MFSVGQQLIPKYTFNRNTGTRTQKTGTRILRPVFFIILKNWTQLKCFSTAKWANKFLHIQVIKHYRIMKINKIQPYATTE